MKLPMPPAFWRLLRAAQVVKVAQGDLFAPWPLMFGIS
jgi:hypothetical protein